MKNNKVLFIAIGVTVFTLILTMVILIFSLSGKFGNKMTNGMTETVRSYTQAINTGAFNKAYEKLSPSTTSYVNVANYSKLMTIMMGEKNVRVDINEKKEIETKKAKIGGKDTEYVSVPLIRLYSKSIDGKVVNLTEDLEIGILEEEQGYKLYIPQDTYYGYINKYVIGKANEFAVEALKNKNTESIVAENAVKIDDYLSFARSVPSSYKDYNEVILQIDLITSYKLLAQGNKEGAIQKIRESYGKAVTVEQKVRVSVVESEIYYAEGQYDKAVEVLKSALDIDPSNKSVGDSYRKINSMMLNQIESSLTRGWSQLQSAIKQEEKEMDRILADIAYVEAETAIKMKQDAPDGYYLKGNIEYCLGKYHDAINSLEKAVALSKVEDSEFKTKAAEILGMARVAQAANVKERDIKSYQRVFNKDVRSLLFRESEISGIVDAIQ